MRNDVSIPPEDSDAMDEPLLSVPETKPVSETPIPPPTELKADVALYDHPNLAPGGAGNFWLLGMIGIAIAIVALVWVLTSLLK
jgi:hypothetical protein